MNQKTDFHPGGHGPVWDLAQDPKSVDLIEAFQQVGKTIVLVCHAPCALLKAKFPNGDPLIKGKPSSGFWQGGLKGIESMSFPPQYLRIRTSGGSPICQIWQILVDSGVRFDAKSVSNRVTSGKTPTRFSAKQLSV
ncbi:MAG: hypothetical protein NTW21_05250 [Verrucomicrobia bacterium]|nr:hypothetical protein [Verrucomicrobiota bacterium]